MSYDTTYASRYMRRLQFSTFNLRRYLRGISDEKRLDEIFWIEAFLRRYTFLSHLTTKSKISVRWIKKLVAATYVVYQFLQSTFNFVAKRSENTPTNLREIFDEKCLDEIF